MCKGSNQGAVPHLLGVSGIGKTSLRLLLKSARSPAPARPRQPLFLTSTKRFPRAGAVVPGQPRMRLQTPRQGAGTGVPFDMTKEATRRPPSTAGLVKAVADETTRRLKDARTPRHPVRAGLVKAGADGMTRRLEDARTPR